MEKKIKKNLLVNMVLVLSLSSAFSAPVFANTNSSITGFVSTGPAGLSEDYELTNDGYITIDEIPNETVEEMVAGNDHEAIKQKELEEQQAEQQAAQAAIQSQRTYYTMIDHGIPARLSTELQDYVYQMCANYGIAGHEKVILAKLYCESSYNPNATHRNSNGTIDVGLAQINSSNHSRLRKTLGITNFYDPYQSIQAGVYMYAEAMKANGYNEEMALAAYNTGRNGISSTSYSRRVMNMKNSAVIG